jgi:putative transposase
LASQSVKTAEAGGPRGFDAGKKIKERKRHILVDTEGNLLGAIVHGGGRAGSRRRAVRACFDKKPVPLWPRHVFADGGYAGEKLRNALKGKGGWTIEIVKRSDAAKGFVLLPRRRVMERNLRPDWAAPAARQGLRSDH